MSGLMVKVYGFCAIMVCDVGYRVEGSGFRIYGLGFRIQR